jgi:hypothetical protein
MTTLETTATADEQREAARLADEMGEASFPASDPPAVWTWEVAPLSSPDNSSRYSC